MSVDVSTIKLWFERAVPTPTDDTRQVQLGVHFEEVDEMQTALNVGALASVLAQMFKQKQLHHILQNIDRKELLDALCDQIVTAVGVAHMFGFDINGALKEVNRSNWSKFDQHGQPLFTAEGKIAKGPDYTPPQLEKFL